jgi:predicted dehydrogenase
VDGGASTRGSSAAVRTPFAINFNHRYAEPTRRSAEAIAARTLGHVVFATWRFGGEPNIGTHP